MGHAQLLGKLQAEMLQGSVPWAPKRVLAELAGRSVDWYLMTEDLPDPENRVSLDSSGRVIVNFRAEQRGAAQAPCPLDGHARCGGPATR